MEAATLQDIGIQPGHRIMLMAMSIVLLGFVLELVRRDLLKEKYALLWLATSVLGLMVGLFPGVIVNLAVLFRFQMLTALFVVSLVFTLAVILGYSVVISRLSERNRRLTQEVALLANRVAEIENEKKDAA